LREELDAFGQRLEIKLGEFFETEADGFYGKPNEEPEIGGIPDIVDFSGILCFGSAGDGAPFCLDYRASPEHPQIVWWDDIHWRVVAPDFDTFLRLFEV